MATVSSIVRSVIGKGKWKQHFYNRKMVLLLDGEGKHDKQLVIDKLKANMECWTHTHQQRDGCYVHDPIVTAVDHHFIVRDKKGNVVALATVNALTAHNAPDVGETGVYLTNNIYRKSVEDLLKWELSWDKDPQSVITKIS